MCRIQSRNKQAKQFKGFKVVKEIDGEYYSPSTGLKYNVGMKIPKMTVRLDNYDCRWKNPLIGGRFYEPLMQGKTGVFRTIANARRVLKHYPEYTIIRMTLGGEMWKGRMGESLIAIGTEILEIETITT